MAIDLHDEQPVLLTIAGFDPSGGAGVIVDVKTFVSFGCRPTAAITSLTFQNSERVFGVAHETSESVRAQLVPLVEEFQIAAVKIGMLPTREVVLEVARLLREINLPAPVVDPVLRSSSGYQMMNEDARAAMLSELLPLARLITPNVPEAESMTGLRIEDENGMRAAALQLREMGALSVLIKGGHLQRPDVRWQGAGQKELMAGDQRLAQWRSSGRAIDVLDNQGHVAVFGGEWIESPQVRGTGCMLSSAIAAGLGKGMKLEAAVSTAKDFVAKAIRKACDQIPLPDSSLH